MAKIKVIQPTQALITINNPATCKYCQSTNTRKHGFVEGVQYHYCNDCKRRFKPDDILYKMKTPYIQVASALDDYYAGKSINEIRDSLNTRYGNCPSSKTVYGWIIKYTNEANRQFKDYHPQVGEIWVGDETVLKLDGKNYWCIDIIDIKTRYLLATKLSSNRETKDIRELMERARDRAGKTPKRVLTDGWKGYLDGIELAYGADSRHIVTDPFAGGDTDNTELIERWHGTLKSRTKTLRGLKSVDTANQFLDGFCVYYNYLRPHETLNGKTPAEFAGVQYNTKSWVDITRMTNPDIKVLVTPAKVSVLGETPVIRPKTRRTYNVEHKRKLRIVHRQATKRGVHTNRKGTVLKAHSFKGSRRVL